MNQSEKCNICTKRLINYKEYTKCTICNQKSHPKCNFLTKTDAELLLEDHDNTWTCYNCMKNIFPLINEGIVNSDIDNSNTTECKCCSKILGKKFTQCTICNENIHKRCNLQNFGCKKCRDDMFPASWGIFFQVE